MATHTDCPECGNPLPLDSPQGLCPQCLMKRGMESGSDPSLENSVNESRQMREIASPKQNSDIELSPGSKLGNYLIERELGRGGMGIVYKAHEESLQRVVALKILAPALGRNPAYAKRFLREARAGARLNHPNIVPVHAVGKVDGQHYISMAYVKGVPLGAFIRKTGQLEVSRAIDIARQIADALAAAHAQGIVHRDIKPDNVMLDQAGRVQVMDFGLARLLSASTQLTGDNSTLGTPSYMSPEQCTGAAVDGRSDLYALGVVLFEMLAGTAPFRGDSPIAIMYQIQHEPTPPLAEINSSVPPEVIKVIERLMAKDPDKRYQEAKQVRDALTRLQGWRRDASPKAKPEKKPAHIPRLPKRPSTRSSPKYLAIGASALAVVAIAGFFINGVLNNSPQPDTDPTAIPGDSADSEEFSPSTPPPERTITFPSDREYGDLYLRDWDDPSFDSFYQRPLGTANGAVTVPEGQDLVAVLDGRHKGALSAYSEIDPNAIQAIRIEYAYEFQPTDIQHLSQMTNLESLVIMKCQRKVLDMTIIGNMVNLRELDIREAKLGVRGMSSLVGLKQLERLTLWGTDISGFELQYISDKTALTYLDLNFNPIDDAGLAHLEGLSELRTLLLGFSNLTDEGLSTLLKFPKLKHLQLDVYDGYHSGWTDAGLEVVAQLERLEWLDVKNQELTGGGMKRLSGMSSLRRLRIMPSMLDEEMAQVLRDELTQIRRLDLDGNPHTMTQEQLAWISQYDHLKILNLSANANIGDDALPELSKLTHLRTLYIHGSALSDEGMKTLRAALPNTTVHD